MTNSCISLPGPISNPMNGWGLFESDDCSLMWDFKKLFTNNSSKRDKSIHPVKDFIDNEVFSCDLDARDLFDCSVPNFAIKPIDLLSKDVALLLDDNTKKRIDLFCKAEDGWDLGDGKKISPESLAVFEVFIRKFNRFQTSPSVFMTHSGYLQLAWEDFGGNSIEIDFLPNGLQCFVEKEGIDEFISLDNDSFLDLTEYLINI